jgi:hypothetical protein
MSSAVDLRFHAIIDGEEFYLLGLDMIGLLRA